MTLAGSRPRALVVAYDFPPHAAVGTQRTLRLVRYLAESGWDVRVLTGDPRTFRRDTPLDMELLKRVPPSVTVLRASTWRPVEAAQRRIRTLIHGDQESSPSKAATAVSEAQTRSRDSTGPRGFARRISAAIDAMTTIPDAEVGWAAPAISRGRADSVGWKPQVIYSSAPPWTGHLVAGALAAWASVPWVADFRDPWARAPWRRARTSWIGNAAATVLEHTVVRRADAVIFTTMAARAEFATRYGAVRDARFAIVPNGCDLSLFDGLKPSPRRGAFVLLHAGSLYGGRSPEPVLRAIARAIDNGLIDRTQFRLRLVGSPSESVTRAAGELKLLDVVEQAGRKIHRETLAEMMSASALLLLQQGTDMSVPAKLYEYFAAGRPILALSESAEIADLLGRSRAGLSVPDNDEQGIMDAIVSLVRRTTALQPAPSSCYDGLIRASETAAILRNVMRREPLPALTGAISPLPHREGL
jgi:glycosyltransferase involved in cell wall biosynthesis